MKLIYILTIFFITAYYSFAQSVSNVRAETDRDVIVVYYDLQAEYLNNRELSTNLYASHNNYQYPLEDVQGDVGSNVSPGTNKKITWNFASELESFNGYIQFKVIPAMNFTFPTSKEALKRGKEHMIEWTGGGENEKLNIELLYNGKSIKKVDNLTNKGAFSWAIPGKLKPGKQYQFKVVNAGSPQEMAISEPFKIKRKMPLGVRVLTLVGIAGAAVAYKIIQDSGGNGGNGDNGGDTELPGPPLPDDIIN